MRIQDLFRRRVQDLPGEPRHSPLLVEELFEDAELLDVRIDATLSTVGILFEMRPSELKYVLGDKRMNCGALVLRQATQVKWDCDASEKTGLCTWPVGRSRFHFNAGLFEASLLLGVFRTMTLSLSAMQVEFYAGTVPVLSREIPDYTEHESVAGLVPDWSMEFIPTNAWYLDAP